MPESATVAEKAGMLFASGHNCTQAVFVATTGEEDPRILKMAEAFGGGIGGAKCLCGAVTGGVMALSIKDRGHLAARLVEEFKQNHRATCCAALSKSFRWNSREHRENCRRITQETAALTARLLQE
ncbi:hypothetical protein GFER_01375 [Geoalkalibacter ferrihydriticus DSM 17813]|uniref:C_GCAxxG_C_C family protein n=1 Tax=Geoalkalibacter ferrihydriticus DSM 17813 TaxID=1121915 RepID=A0A0C2DXK8_9BACT|nr:hypothetical protein GFER_01375 [Geoalkalibacter ferrihydriticus DSM 17813]